MTENEKTELFDKWYDKNYDEWAEGEEGIALREELEQAFKGGIAELDMKRKAERQIFQGIVEKKNEQLTKAKEIIRTFLNMPMPNNEEVFADVGMFLTKAEQFLKEIEE